MTPRALLGLRPGVRLRVALRGGREVEVELLGNPWLEARGRPGVGRVTMHVLDTEHAARIAARGPHHTAFGHNPVAMLRAKHTVSGAQVLEVLP